MSKLNLAVFNTQPPHIYYGGVERRIIETAKRLTQQINTTVYSGTKSGFKKPTSINNVNFVPGFSTDKIYPIDNWFFNNTISRSAKKINADIYEAHTVSGYKLLNTFKKQKKKEPFIQTIHGVLADEYIKATQKGAPTIQTKIANIIMWKLSKLEKQAAEKADIIITISKYAQNKITQLYEIEKEKIRIVPNGVDLQKFKPRKNLTRIKQQIRIENKQCILFVGRLIPRKGLSFLVQAAKHIIKENQKTVFLIVGDGPQKNQLIRYLEKNRIRKNFVFLGDIKDEILPLIYNCAEIFVFPSVQEGQGIALLEAQASSKPVITFNTGGVRETIINKETGFLVKPNNKDLANTIINLLKNGEMRNKMGKKGREFVSQNFSWEKSAKKLLETYNEANLMAK